MLKQAVCIRCHNMRTEVLQPRGPGENSSGRRADVPAESSQHHEPNPLEHLLSCHLWLIESVKLSIRVCHQPCQVMLSRLCLLKCIAPSLVACQNRAVPFCQLGQYVASIISLGLQSTETLCQVPAGPSVCCLTVCLA